jgi:hypothetical protein
MVGLLGAGQKKTISPDAVIVKLAMAADRLLLVQK